MPDAPKIAGYATPGTDQISLAKQLKSYANIEEIKRALIYMKKECVL